MDLDDLEPRNRKPPLKNLEEMSIQALKDYIADLEAEIDRARRTIAAKEAARSGADSFFRR
ncbi:MAG: DUF1192 domain-containing protein [Magnetospirillum sp. WYHS-4]